MSWARDEFGTIALGDRRLNKRAVPMAQRARVWRGTRTPALATPGSAEPRTQARLSADHDTAALRFPGRLNLQGDKATGRLAPFKALAPPIPRSHREILALGIGPGGDSFRFARRQITRPRFCCRYDLRQLRYSMA